jgi:UDP-N-acetylmuramate--alanine ligase
VVEADESDGTHVQLPLQAAVVTNIDVDHLDHFGSFERIVESFRQLLAQTPGPTVVCADDEQCARLAALLGCTTYGTADDADYLISNLQHVDGRQRFTIRHDGDDLVTIDIGLRGMFNVRNATAAAAMAHQLGVAASDIAAALESFAGVVRRFDVRAVDDGATFVDDYAHIPAEIAAVLGAARHGADGWSRVIAVFQPNRFNRMAVLSPEYRDAFVDADVIAITEIYASGTSPIAGVTGRLVVDAVAAAHPHARVLWIPHRDDLVDFVAAEARAGDVCISMGCGDIASFPDEVVARRRARRQGSDAR